MTKTTALSTSPATIKQSIAFLKKGRAFIAKGWTQGAYHRRVGPKNNYCMLGGLNRAAGGGGVEAGFSFIPRDRRSALSLGERYLRMGVARKIRRAFRHADVANFNDAPSRTQKQVLEAYDIAIAKAERDLASVS